jgi:amidohydrolase
MAIGVDQGLPEAREAVRALVADAVALRRDLHEHAELSTEEFRTQALILDRLRVLGLDDVRAVADTGATAIVRGGRPGPNLLWRADIDALPLEEETGLPFASTSGAMHACGHDGHVAIALMIAEVLQASRERLAGTVRFAFQPAEEHVGGAQRMVKAGVMDDPKVDRTFGLHIWSSAPLGDVLVTPGPIFAAATHFRIIVRGRGGHAAAPHETIDPILVAAHVVVALQSVVSRSVNPAETAVLTVGRIQGGVRGNIIPNEVMMSGTVRTYEPGVLDRVLRRMREIISGVTAAWSAEGQFDVSTLPACVNDPETAAMVASVAAAFVGAEHVAETRVTGADDMSFFLDAAPGVYFLLGAAPRHVEHVQPHHHPGFDFDEACMPIGAEVALRIIEAATGSAL